MAVNTHSEIAEIAAYELLKLYNLLQVSDSIHYLERSFAAPHPIKYSYCKQWDTNQE
jgi:hypothetical protein|tara:strand:+ start:494 stop:664 length:171 start_codon:yes stop_codon:yes gene_type:complete